MALYHLSAKALQRSIGRSATAAVAYRAGERILDERTGAIHDYTRRSGVEHAELTLPGGATENRAEFWNRIEKHHKRGDAVLAREIEIALPSELTSDERKALAVGYAKELADRYGVAVDIAIHLPGNKGDQRNHHAHILLSACLVSPSGELGKKAVVLDPIHCQRNNVQNLADTERPRWQNLCNKALETAGHDARIDHRSLFAQRASAMEHGDVEQAANLDRMPTIHLGPNVVQMEQRGVPTELGEINRNVQEQNAKVIDLVQVRREIEREKTRLAILVRPDHVLEILDSKESVFREKDIARELSRYLSEEEADFARAGLAQSVELVNLTPERTTGAVFSTRDMIAAEIGLAENSERMAVSYRHVVASSKAISVLDSTPFKMLSDEQRAAVLHVTTGADMAAIAGAAGSGKSTALAAARQIWESHGYRVRGAALAGKAADGLQEGAGIESRTLHSLEFGFKNGTDQLTSRDVLVIDEAGMVGSRQLGRVVALARQAGAKVVLVGDAEQLQPIEAGAAFRAVCERVGVAEIATIRRQHLDWAKDASQAFARGETAAGLAAYQERGAVHLLGDRKTARSALVADWLADKSEGSRIILAHTNVDVQAINGTIREARRQAGELGEDARFTSATGLREFAAGDRLVFLKNDRALGVKNGMLGTVDQADGGRLSVTLDNGEKRTVEQSSYDAIDHGYAVTIHKAQGMTVDRTFVLASGGMDRHLTYVSMTRHSDAAVMYAGQAEFGGYDGLVRRLSRAQPKETVLDFIERRGIADTPRSWIEDGRAVLGRLSDRFTVAVDRLRERFGPEILKGNEHERNNGDRQPNHVARQAATRAGIELSGTGSRKPDLGRVGKIPPPFARGRLRSLSELGVVRFPERGEVLLPRDVPRHVEHQGAERDNALRRDSDGLIEKSANSRQASQGEVAADQLRELVKQREGDLLPTVAANDSSPEKIKAEWQAERARQFTRVVNKARKSHARAANQLKRQEAKLARTDQARPQKPTGLLASFKKATYDQMLTGWSSVRAVLERRFNQVHARLALINDYMQLADPYELPTKGERLADKLAAKTRPELAANFQKVIEKEKAAAIELQRDKFMNRRQGKQEKSTMKQESIEDLKQRTDANRLQSEKAERTELDKAGFLAGLQEQNAEQKYDQNQITAQQSESVSKELNAGTDKGDQTKEARQREILERFKEKARNDRDNSRGGRG